MTLNDRLNASVDNLARRFSALADETPASGQRWGQTIGDTAGNGGRWADLVLPSGGAGSGLWGATVQQGTAERLLGGATGVSSGWGLPDVGKYLDRFTQAHGAHVAADAAKNPAAYGQGVPAPGAVGETGGGMAPNVARWDSQARQTFGDLLDPDIMLAIMTNESGGDPSAHNAAGDAWGLFQNVGLGAVAPDQQFAAARTLAQQKLASIAQSYAANGVNPDTRTRARDVALAWAGHFDYATGRPNPTSRDVGSGQTADQYAAIFLANYDRIKAGRQAPAGGQGVTAAPGSLIATAQTLLGTPYQLGGLRAHPNDPRQGLDCSEYVSWVYGQHGVTLVPNAQQQFNQTTRVGAGQLQPGDLVFFHGTNDLDPDYITHVGIYLGNGQMINAENKGVAVSSLSDPYWAQHIAGYGRVGQAAGGGGQNRT